MVAPPVVARARGDPWSTPWDWRDERTLRVSQTGTTSARLGRCSTGVRIDAGTVEALLAESERVGRGAGLQEGDLQRPLADRVVLADKLVHAALPEEAAPVLVHVDAV